MRILFFNRIGKLLAFAGIAVMVSASSPTGALHLKPAAVIYFNDGSTQSQEQAERITRMINELASVHHIAIENTMLPSEDALSRHIEKIADKDIGLVVIIAPQKSEELVKLPSLYPDISFTVIGASTPLYFTNVRAMNFRDQEGSFMMGALAALRSQTSVISFVSSHDTPLTRNLAYAYLQGAKHSNPEISVIQKLGDKIMASGTDEVEPDIVFVQDEALLEATIQHAKKHNQMVISNDHDLTARHPGVVLTSLLKHYDLAMYQTFRSYSRGEWKAGSQSLGIGSGFIDYALSANNKAILPKETVEQIETTKDFVAQGVVQVNNLVQ